MKTACITGSTSGIGLALAKQLSSGGYQLVLLGRNSQKLTAVCDTIGKKHIKATITADFSTSQGIQDAIFALNSLDVPIDLAINNAGFGLHGAFDQTDGKMEQAMIHVNVEAVVVLSKFFLKKMAKQGHGHIINIASAAAFQPGPFMAVYFATKAFVLQFTESIAAEQGHSPIKIQVVCPGAVSTEFQKTSKTIDLDIMRKRSSSTPQQMAEYIIKASKGNAVVLVPGFKHKILAQLPRMFPRILVRKIMTRLMKKTR